jgi:CSLREA domain-containing protein
MRHHACRPLIAAALLVLPVAAAFAQGGPPRHVFVVNSDDDTPGDTCDARHCNLREAIDAANRRPGSDRIRFDLPAGALIEPLSPLPPLRGGVLVDGTPADGDACPFPGIRIDGGRLPRDGRQAPLADVAMPPGFDLRGDGNALRALAVTGFPGDGIAVDGNRNVLECLFVGVDASGLEAAGNGGHGIVVRRGRENRVGGETRALGNLVGGNRLLGLRLHDALATALGINHLGTDILGQPVLPNGVDDGVDPLPPPAASPLPPAAAARLAVLVERKVATLAQQYANAFAPIFHRYAAQLRRRSDLPPPADFTELARALAAFPDLQLAFAKEVVALNRGERARQAWQLEVSRDRFRASPTFGRAPAPFDAPDPLGEAIDGSAPGEFALGGLPSARVAVRHDPVLTPISPFVFWYMQTFGPTSFGGGPLDVVGPTCFGFAPCTWPIVHDLLPRKVWLYFETDDFTTQEVTDMVEEDGYFLGLYLNGTLLRKGPIESAGGGHGVTDFSVVRLPTSMCTVGMRCIAIEVFFRDSLPGASPPWVFELRIEQLQPLAIPQVVGIDEFGNPIVATEEAVVINRSFKSFTANATNATSWFVEAMEPTFRSDRCVTCHAFGTIAAVEAHHASQGVSTFGDAHLVPSLFVPGGHVISCSNCHWMPLTRPDGGAFNEIEWRVPHLDLDVDWSSKTAAQVCARVKANLPDKVLRHLHFHGDARLFWAQEVVASAPNPLPKAAPMDYAEFLRRFDAWNLGGAPCP